MGFLDYILGFSAEAPSIFPHDASDERAWRTTGQRDIWGGHSGPATTGTYVNPDDAIGVSCIFLGVRIYANLLGTSPIRFYRNLPRDEGEDQIYDHPLLSVLSPDGMANPWMTGAMWRMWSEAQASLWGLGLSEIKFGPQGLELWPIEAEHIPQIDHLESGRKRFTISEPGKPLRTLMQDQVFRIEGFGTHKLIPESLLRRSREAVAVWLAQQQYRGTYFERGASPSIIFQHPGTMSDKALVRFTAQVQGRVGGNRNAHKALVTEENMTTKEFGHTARNAQLVEAWDAQAVECARWMGLPPYMFGVSKQPPYASREQATREFLDISLKPKAVLWEGAIKRDLIIEREIVAEVDLDHLKRGDALTQAQTDAIYIMNGVLDENEVRRSLGRNRIAGLDGPRRSVNQDRGGDPRQPRPDNPGDRETRAQAEAGDIVQMLGYMLSPANMEHARELRQHARTADVRGEERVREAGLDAPVGTGVAADDQPEKLATGTENATTLSGSDSRLLRTLESSARQCLRKEVSSLRHRAIQLASNPPAWHLWLHEFYRSHTETIADRLAIGADRAAAYTEAHRVEVEKGGIRVCDEWEKVEDGERVARAVKEMVEL